MKTVQKKWFVIVVLAILLCLGGLVMSGTAFSSGGGQCLDMGDGTIIDAHAALMWQKATAGPMDWSDAMSYASDLSLGGNSNWRLPTKEELEGLFNSECKKLMDVQSTRYWSSTPHDVYTVTAWGVDFPSGKVDFHFMVNSYYVRVVRSGFYL